jgi:hypothetical protein
MKYSYGVYDVSVFYNGVGTHNCQKRPRKRPIGRKKDLSERMLETPFVTAYRLRTTCFTLKGFRTWASDCLSIARTHSLLYVLLTCALACVGVVCAQVSVCAYKLFIISLFRGHRLRVHSYMKQQNFLTHLQKKESLVCTCAHASQHMLLFFAFAY